MEPALPRVLADPADLTARADVQQASLLAGLAISQTRTAIAHAISYPLTLHLGVPHGLACSFTLPAILDLFDAPGQAIPLDDGLRRRIRCMLGRLDLAQGLASYANRDDVWSLRDLMRHPGRSDNFTMPISEETMRLIVFSSLTRADYEANAIRKDRQHDSA